MHTAGIVIASWIAISASVCGVMLPVDWLTAGLIAGVSLVGVPHGGLDHWTGRRLLSRYFQDAWWAVFFPAYLLIACVVALGWIFVPVATAVSFFLVSAWHFGHEESTEDAPSWSRFLDSVARGGLLIWLPVLMRPEEVEQILKSLVSDHMILHVTTIMTATQCLAIPLTICAVAFMVNDISRRRYVSAIRTLSFACLFCFANVLVSFGMYFCGWHSVRGLARLASEYRLSPSQLLFAVAPLSIGAVVLSVVGMWMWSSGIASVESWHRTLFISLSAIAVPHLILHGPIAQCSRAILEAHSRPSLPLGRVR
jgi:Brp/Blh family beta-carotene 15,15'-monooxygenase